MDHRITRRTGLTATALAATTAAVGLPAAAFAAGDPAPYKRSPAAESARSAPSWRRGEPHRHPWDRRGSGKTLREAQPGAVSLDAETLEELPGIIRAGLEFDPPRFAGASVLVASQAGIALRARRRLCAALEGREQGAARGPVDPRAHRHDLRPRLDLEDLHAATAVMQLVEKGDTGPRRHRSPSYLPRFAENGKGRGHRAAAAHARRRPAGLHQPLLRVPGCALAPGCRAHRRAEDPRGHRVRLQRSGSDHARPGRGEALRSDARRVRPRAHHRASRDARDDVQPAR